jgi:hypothetical protein
LNNDAIRVSQNETVLHLHKPYRYPGIVGIDFGGLDALDGADHYLTKQISRILLRRELAISRAYQKSVAGSHV